MGKIKVKFISYFVLLTFSLGCTEPFEIEVVDFENLLVIEASISNEIKHQVIKISRTAQLDDFEPAIEHNAQVQVEDSEGNTYNFSQLGDTREYHSDQMFNAKPSLNYRLRITTQDKKEYVSNDVRLEEPVEISNLYAELVEVDGLEGIQVFLDTYTNNQQTKYYRYEFEETYKIKVPEPSNWSWEFTNYDFIHDLYEVELTRRDPETICYSTSTSTGIIQASSNNLNENNIVRLPIHFLFKTDSVLRERYSILVKQYAQSQEAYTFYKTTEDLGNIESKLSQSQPGFINGNITSTSDPTEKVVGFFEVAQFTTKRIYFNYKDFDLPFPPYFTTCNELELYANSLLKKLIEFDNFQIQDYKTGGEPNTRYIIYKDVCTDCTTFGSNIKPEFWED